MKSESVTREQIRLAVLRSNICGSIFTARSGNKRRAAGRACLEWHAPFLKRMLERVGHKPGPGRERNELIQVPRGNGFHAFRHANATLMNSFGTSQKLRQHRLGHAEGSPVTETIYTHAISEDGKRIAAQLGNAVWGVLDATGRKKGNGSEGASSKPFLIN